MRETEQHDDGTDISVHSCCRSKPTQQFLDIIGFENQETVWVTLITIIKKHDYRCRTDSARC